MKINHIALWTNQLEELREFYTKYFDGRTNEKYINPQKGFESYFMRFEEGAALEIMRKINITEPDSVLHIGLAHFSFSVGSKEAVIEFIERFRKDGYTIASEPRTTGDGFFEGSIIDPDNNLVEINI